MDTLIVNQPEKSFTPVNKTIITPEQYGLLKRMKTNRLITKSNVVTKVKSVLKYGQFRPVLVVWNSKKNCYFIIDGQHLIEALKQLKMEINCLIYKFDNEKDITDFMITVNTTAKSWSLEDYINSWAGSGNKHYERLAEAIFETNMQATVIMQAYTQVSRSKATKMVKEGKFNIFDKDRGDELIEYVCQCSALLPNTRQINEALIKIMLNTEGYDNIKMKRNLKKVVKKFIFSTKESELYKQLVEIYNS